MSDLIDFDSPNTKNSSLPSPLIPVPDNLKNNEYNSNEAGPQIIELEKRRSIENNPFDLVMREIIDYERNKEDPFETVIEKVKEFSNRVYDEPKSAFNCQSVKCSDIVKLNKISEETKTNVDIPFLGENDMSIISDLNNTNLISDNVNENQVISLLSCDNKVPNINISSMNCSTDLSILNCSSMNDSLLDHEINNKEELKSLPVDINNRFRSMSQTTALGNKNFSPKSQSRRSMSTSDAVKNNMYAEDYLLNSAHSSLFDDPFNNAFRKSSLRSAISSNSSCLSSQFDLSKNLERQTSNSSVFSGLSNVSNIPIDYAIKMRQDRFCSESSTTSGISNLSTISMNNIVSSSDSSVFSNDTLNKGFIASRIHLSSSTDKSPSKSRDKSDLIKKFFEIKTRMSTSEVEQPKNKDKEDFVKVKSNSFSKPNVLQKEKNEANSEEILIDVDSSFNSVFNDENEVNDIISHEAKLLAETFEKMASNEESNSPTEDDLLAKTQLNFDYLPKSDDDTVDNLIDLPVSPVKTETTKVDAKTEKVNETDVTSARDNIKELENEFIDKENFEKKAEAATLMLNLEKLIKEQNNPDAYKIYNDLQKLLGIECDNNTEILRLHLQNTTDSLQNKSKESDKSSCKDTKNSNNELNMSKPNVSSDCEKDSIEQNYIHTDDSKSSINESKDEIVNKHKNVIESKVNEKNLDGSSENKTLVENLIESLNKIVNEKKENCALDILRSLGTVLSMTAESQTKTKNKQIIDSKMSKKSTPMKQYRSSNSLYKPPNSYSAKNQSFEVLPLRRSMSTNPIGKNSLLDVSFINKNKRKSELLNIKKRFPSDPGFENVVAMEKKEIEIPIIVEKQVNLKTSKTAEQVKTKLKKKINSEAVTKKGPLKAVIPLGNMQKRVSVGQKFLHNITPPKPLDSASTLNASIVSSTPNTSGVNKNSKSQPTASSTPNMEGLKTQQRTNVQKQRNSKSMMCNMSPVLLNSSLKGNIGTSSIRSNTRMERTLSPQKRPLTPRKNFDCSFESRLPRYSPRPVRVRNYSLDDLKTAKSMTNIANSPKYTSEKKLNRPPVSSPLKNSNKLTYKGKIVSRLGKSNNSQSGAEKENYV